MSSLKDRLNELAEAVKKSNQEFRKDIRETGVKGAVAKSFSEIGFIKNRADRVINQLNQAEWVSAHEPGYFDSGLAYKLQETKAILEKSSLLDGFDNIVPVGKLRNWIDELAASSTSYAAIRSFQKREQVKTKLFEFSKKLDNASENKAFNKAKKNLNATNQKLFEDLIELREGRRIQEGALKMQGPIALRKEEREKIEQAIKDRTVGETLISAQISANLEVFEGETDLNNKKISMLGEANEKIETAKKNYLDKQGYMTYLFNRTFKLADGFSAEVDKNGIVTVFNAEGNAILPNDPDLDPENPEGVIQVDESSKGDMFASSIAEFEEFSTENIGLTPKSMASRYSRAMKAKVKAEIQEGKTTGSLTGEFAKRRTEYVNGLLETLDKQASKENFKHTREYKEYQENVSRIKMSLDAERLNLYDRVLQDYETLLGEDAIREFTERVAKLPNNDGRAKAYAELKREIVEGLPGSTLAIGRDTIDQMMESIHELESKQFEINNKYIEPFMGSMNPLLPAKSPEGGYIVYDPESKAGQENNGAKVVATFEEAKKYYSFLESPEDLGEFLQNPDFREQSSVADMTEEEFLKAIENHQLVPTKIIEYKETYDNFLTQTKTLEYARDKAIDEVQKGVSEGNVQLNDTTRAYLAPNADGEQTWFIEENGETRELLENSEILSLESLEEDAIYGFVETKLMPIKLKELDKLAFNKENEFVDESGTPVLDEKDKEIIRERVEKAHEKNQKEYAEAIEEQAKAQQKEKGEAENTAGGKKSGPSTEGEKKSEKGSTKSGSEAEHSADKKEAEADEQAKGDENQAGINGTAVASGSTAGGNSTEVTFKTKPYKCGDVNVAGIIKFLQIKKFMSYDLIVESAERLAIQYKRLAKSVPAPVVKGSYTIGSSAPTGPAAAGPTTSGPVKPITTGPVNDGKTTDEPENEAGDFSIEEKEKGVNENEQETLENDGVEEEKKEGAENEDAVEKKTEDEKEVEEAGAESSEGEGKPNGEAEAETSGEESKEENIDDINKEIDEAEKARAEAEKAKAEAEAAEEEVKKETPVESHIESTVEVDTPVQEETMTEEQKPQARLAEALNGVVASGQDASGPETTAPANVNSAENSTNANPAGIETEHGLDFGI